MNPLKVVALLAGGMCIAGAIGGSVLWYRNRKRRHEAKTPERVSPRPDADDEAEPVDTRARGHIEDLDGLEDDVRQELDELFPEGWPPDEATIENLEKDDVIVFAVQSDPVGPYTNTREELLNAKVLSVETNVVRGRVLGPVAHAEHHGSHAGHGFRVGDLVEVPRSKILVAARPTEAKGTGYGSEGKPANTFKPSNVTDTVYKVRPGTPYDLAVPYRTDELQWHIDRGMVKMVHVGNKGSLEQILFAEDSMRGPVSVRALDHDPREGIVFVARWDFELVA